MPEGGGGETLRVGIVGAGSWAQQAHLPGFAACPGVEIVALCESDPVRAAEAAAAWAIPAVYPSAAAMVAALPVDLISVVTPDDAHDGDVRAALAVGAHVLCEKPLATTLAEARALADLAQEAGVMTQVGFAMRFAPAMTRLRQIVTSGEIGELRLLQAFQQNGQFLDPAAPFHWKMDAARTGGGAVVEYGIHTIDLALWIMGAASSVCATSRTWTAERPRADGQGYEAVTGDDSTAWLMEFTSGAIGMCHAGWATAGRAPGLEIRVFGSRGAVRCSLSDEFPQAEQLWLAGPDGHFSSQPVAADVHDADIADLPWWVRFPARLIRSFVADIAQGTATGPTFAAGVAAQEVLDALLLSTRERRWVDLPLPAGAG